MHFLPSSQWVATPLTFSIATGLSLGLISFTVVKVAAGNSAR